MPRHSLSGSTSRYFRVAILVLVLACTASALILATLHSSAATPAAFGPTVLHFNGNPPEDSGCTGIGAVDAASGREAATAVVTRVFMLPITDQAIDDYVTTGEPLDKAGAYAIQDLDGALVEGVVGAYTNVVGLPVEATRRLLEGFGVVSERRA